MTVETEEDDWNAAQAALSAAQRMPGGPERIEALKRAGQLRFDALERQCEREKKATTPTKVSLK